MIVEIGTGDLLKEDKWNKRLDRVERDSVMASSTSAGTTLTVLEDEVSENFF